jgi:hypothetical protein
MKHKALLFCLMMIGLFNYQSHAQNFKLVAKIDTVAKMAQLDNFGNLFIITPANDVLKFNAKGKFLWNYSNKSFGDVSQIDVTDPMRVILYYHGFQQIVVLNNNLSEISTFSFNQNPDVQITQIASANNNGFWIYDQINRELKKLTNNFIDDIKSGNLYQRNGIDMDAIYMLTDDQYIYINDKKTGVRVFDRFGNFYKTAVVYPLKDFEVSNNEISFFDNGNLMKYNYLTFKLDKIELPDVKNIVNALLRFNQLVILTEKDITLYMIENR